MTSFFTRFSRWLRQAFLQQAILGLLTLFCCVMAPAWGQNREPLNCGTPDISTEQTKAFAKFIKQAEARQSNKSATTVTYLGIKPWRTAGTTLWPDDKIVSYVNLLNVDFQNTNIQFYIVEGDVGVMTNFTSSTLTYPNNQTALVSAYFHTGAINVYFCNTLLLCDGSPCQRIGGYCSSLDKLVTFTDRPTNNPNPNVQAKLDDIIFIGSGFQDVLSHEMGHFFGLLHTFNGAVAANCNDREQPGAADTDRGDLVADTQADPYDLFVTKPYNITTCAYTGNLQHCQTAQLYQPPVDNTMSYWNSFRCPHTFSVQQLERMKLFLAPRLDPNNEYDPDSGPPGTTSAPTITSGVIVGTQRNIRFNGAAGGTGYILERSTTVDFTYFELVETVVASTTLATASYSVLDPGPTAGNLIYYYRIRATNGKQYSNVFALACDAPTATLSGSQTITGGQSATYTIALTGSPPWRVQFEGLTYSNVTTSPLRIVSTPFPSLPSTYVQTTTGGSVTSSCGTVPLSGTASVTVSSSCPAVSVTLTYGNIGCGQTTASGSIFTNPTSYTAQWRNLTTGTNFPSANTQATGLTAGNYRIILTGPGGCLGPQQLFTIRDYGPNGSTATLVSTDNNRIPRGQQTSIRVTLTGTAPWSVTYAGRGGRQLVASNITTSFYDIAVAPDSTTTYRLVAVSGQCSPTAVSGTVTLIVVPALNGLEYFVDADPGVGQATSVAVGSNQTDANQTIAVPVSVSGGAGVRVLGVRAKDANGYWSPTTLRFIVVLGTGLPSTTAITAAEYFVDTDPGVGQATSVAIGSSPATVAVPIAATVGAGVRVLGVRAKDGRNRWSPTTLQTFVVLGTGSGSTTAITAAEYYVDTDPGVGRAVALPGIPTPGVPYNLSINLTGLMPGTHTIAVRTKDGRNRWSFDYVRSFMVILDARGISRIEYFFDNNDPGVGLAQPVTVDFPNSTTVNGVALASTSSLSVGSHTVKVRAEGRGLVWSVTNAASFMVTPCTGASATLAGSFTTTTDQPLSFSVGIGGSPLFSLTANGQVQTNIPTNTATITLTLTTPGTYTLTAQSLGLAVANSCGPGLVNGQIRVTVQQGTCTVMQTVKAGSWNDPTVWSCGRLPLLTDAVLVRHAVTVPVSFVARAQKVSFDLGGKLNWGINARLLLGL